MGVHIEGLRETTQALSRASAEVGDQRATMGALASKARDELTARLRRTSPTAAKSVRTVTGQGVALVTFPVASTEPHRTNLRATLTVPPTDTAMEARAPEVLAEGWNTIAERNGLT